MLFFQNDKKLNEIIIIWNKIFRNKMLFIICIFMKELAICMLDNNNLLISSISIWNSVSSKFHVSWFWISNSHFILRYWFSNHFLRLLKLCDHFCLFARECETWIIYLKWHWRNHETQHLSTVDEFIESE